MMGFVDEERALHDAEYRMHCQVVENLFGVVLRERGAYRVLRNRNPETLRVSPNLWATFVFLSEGETTPPPMLAGMVVREDERLRSYEWRID